MRDHPVEDRKRAGWHVSLKPAPNGTVAISWWWRESLVATVGTVLEDNTKWFVNVWADARNERRYGDMPARGRRLVQRLQQTHQLQKSRAQVETLEVMRSLSSRRNDRRTKPGKKKKKTK